jgi:phage terminase large subunit
MNENNERTIKLHPKQFDAFNFTRRYGAVICGVQSGKTYLGATWANKKITEFPKGNGLISAPTYKILQQSTLDKFFNLFPEWFRYYKKQESVIDLPEGGKIYIRSADEPLGIEGMTLDWAWLDEAGMMGRLIWVFVRARTAIRKGQVLMTTTPYNLGWLFTDFYKPFKEGKDEDLVVFTWKSVENPYFDKEFYEKEKERLSGEEFARRYEGEFTKMEGLVYDLPSDRIIEEKKINNPEITIGGIDWGFRNPAALWVGKLKDKVWYVVDEWYKSGKTTPEIIERCKELQKTHGVNRWYADSAEPDRIEECKRAGLYILEGSKDLKGGISQINQLIRENRLFVFDKCENFIDEINFYHYPEVRGENLNPKDEPQKKNDHLMDAMRYAITTYEPAVNEGEEEIVIYKKQNWR